MLQPAPRASGHLRRFFLPFDPPFESYFDETDMAEMANIQDELTGRLIPACAE
ncbi:hypothetical protein [Burkholderia multivorans]|uniref:hypothetical protein n=1 Tax=Burkholderia multivorans TaxID=87883 RepID=UPI00207C476E|nr:hypothetical protein [Burkholderia multivorans]